MDAKKKLFVVKFKFEDDDKDVVILKAFAGHLSASQYVDSDVKNWDKDYEPENGIWTDPWHYSYKNPNDKRYSTYEIEEVEVEQSIVLPELPFIEKENLTLKAENDELRKKLADANGAISEARSFLTMWDGGWNYDKEHILKNVHKAKAILESSSMTVMVK